MVEIDISGAGEFEDYSAHTLGLAEYAISSGKIRLRAGGLSATAESLSGSEVWSPAASLDDSGEVIGVTCTCPNGQKGGVRARCWHAAALEKLMEEGEVG